MNGYKKIEGYYVDIYIADNINLKEDAVIESLVSSVDYTKIIRNRITGEEETQDGYFEIEATYPSYFEGCTYKEFLEERIKEIESAIYHDIMHTEQTDVDVEIEEIEAIIYGITAKKEYVIDYKGYKFTKENIMFIKGFRTEEEYQEFLSYYNSLDSVTKTTITAHMNKTLERYLDCLDDLMNF